MKKNNKILNMPYKSKAPKSNKICKYCNLPAKLNIVNGRNKGYCRTCGSEECTNEQYKSKEVCLKKGRKKELNIRWLIDRTQLKQKRNISEERYFFKEIMEERNYTCELTNQKGKLSVHHICGVWSNPELQYDKANCILITNHIHNKFHKMYGNRSSKEDWNIFIGNKEYLDEYLIRKKKNHIPYRDRTNERNGRLLIKEKISKKWLCLCDCGNEKLVSTGNLKNTYSCGCYKKEVGLENIKINKIWQYSPVSNKKLRNVQESSTSRLL